MRLLYYICLVLQVVMSKDKTNKIPRPVMLNLVQHLIESIGYETLKRAQGDISGVLRQPRRPHFLIDGDIPSFPPHRWGRMGVGVIQIYLFPSCR